MTLLALAGAVNAAAATARTGQYVAGPGEQNDVTIVIAYTGDGVGTMTVTDTGATITAGAGCVAASPTEVTCGLGLHPHAEILLGDGDDTLVLSETGDDPYWCDLITASGGNGNDVLIGGDVAECLYGGPGDDRLEGGKGQDFSSEGDQGDTLVGGPGADVLIGGGHVDSLEGGRGDDALFGGTGPDVLDGGGGADELNGGPGLDITSYTRRTAPVRVDLDGVADDGVAGERDRLVGIEDALGGRGDDVLIGNGDSNHFLGRDGRDLLRGRAGDDRLEGGEGADDVGGGPGDDTVASSDLDVHRLIPFAPEFRPRPDRLRGARGNDRLISLDDGPDALAHGGPGRDSVLADRSDAGLVSIERVRYGRLP